MTERTVVLCAGKIDYAHLPVSTNTTNAMIPVNGKPVIGWVLDDLLQKGITQAHVVLRAEDERLASFLQRAYAARMDIIPVHVSAGGSILHSLQAGLAGVASGVVRVLLGDTLVHDNFQSDSDFVYLGEVEDSHRWCLALIGADGVVHDYVDKQEFAAPQKTALVGYYHFQHCDFLRACVADAIHNGERELSFALKRYGAQYPLRAKRAAAWYDFGHIENLIKARQGLLQSRYFNSLSINPVLNTITKVSEHNQKLEDELAWYLAMPEELQALSPRILSHERVNGKLHIVQEYYGYPTLAELYVYGEMDADMWASILRQIMRVHAEFKKYGAVLNGAEMREIYISKTRERLTALKNQSADWAALLTCETISFNETTLPNVFTLLQNLEDKIENLLALRAGSVVHGDLCFSNILFDVNNQIIRLIDPRGSFGKKGIYGDPRYDVAKLRHSVSGLYDFIMADMFTVREEARGVFSGQVFSNGIQQRAAAYFDRLVQGQHGYDLQQIRLIEGLLFISMLPYHRDQPTRQKMLYLTGLTLLNEVL